MVREMKFAWALLPLTLLFCIVSTESYASQSSACSALIKQKQFDLAAVCFQRLAAKIPDDKKLNALQRKLKGFFLKSAAKAFKLSAKEQKEPQEAARLYDKAAILLREALSKKLYLRPYEKQSMQGMLLEIEQSVGYATLIVLNGYKDKPRLELTGHGFQSSRTMDKKWIQKLRPGKYALKMIFPNEPTQSLDIELKRSENRVIQLNTDLKRVKITPKQSAAFWLATAGGIALIGAGAAVAIIGYVVSAGMEQTYAKEIAPVNADFKRAHDDKGISEEAFKNSLGARYDQYLTGMTDYKNGKDVAGGLVSVGWIVGALGAGTIGIAVLFLRSKPAVTNTTSTALRTAPFSALHKKSSLPTELLLAPTAF